MNDLDFSDSEVKSVACELGLPEAAFEDPERNRVIHNWTNADIVACPGSGKTTILLAKLLLLLGKGIVNFYQYLHQFSEALISFRGVFFQTPHY